MRFMPFHMLSSCIQTTENSHLAVHEIFSPLIREFFDYYDFGEPQWLITVKNHFGDLLDLKVAIKPLLTKKEQRLILLPSYQLYTRPFEECPKYIFICLDFVLVAVWQN